jgi:hypothetical protein
MSFRFAKDKWFSHEWRDMLAAWIGAILILLIW